MKLSQRARLAELLCAKFCWIGNSFSCLLSWSNSFCFRFWVWNWSPLALGQNLITKKKALNALRESVEKPQQIGRWWSVKLMNGQSLSMVVVRFSLIFAFIHRGQHHLQTIPRLSDLNGNEWDKFALDHKTRRFFYERKRVKWKKKFCARNMKRHSASLSLQKCKHCRSLLRLLFVWTTERITKLSLIKRTILISVPFDSTPNWAEAQLSCETLVSDVNMCNSMLFRATFKCSLPTFVVTDNPTRCLNKKTSSITFRENRYRNRFNWSIVSNADEANSRFIVWRSWKGRLKLTIFCIQKHFCLLALHPPQNEPQREATRRVNEFNKRRCNNETIVLNNENFLMTRGALNERFGWQLTHARKDDDDGASEVEQKIA